VSIQPALRYSFQALAADTEFEVVSFTFDEALSQPFQLQLELVSHQDDVDFTRLLDQPALFTLWQGQRPLRYVHGLVSSFSQGETGFCRTRYRARVEPQLARADLRSNWRIFQHKTVPQIVQAMLERQGITDAQIIATVPHAQREFCVQAGETDLAFIARLLAEEGFVYRFAHSATQHALIITDSLVTFGLISHGLIKPADDHVVLDEDAREAGPDQVLYRANSGGEQAEPCLRRLRYSQQVRSVRQVQRDYTFTNPAYRQEHQACASGAAQPSADYERFDYPGRYQRDAVGKPFTETRLNALRHDACIAEVEGDDIRLQAGLSFTLIGHPREDLNAHWRITAVCHQGSQFTSLEEEASGAQRGSHYQQCATLVPRGIEWRPAPLAKPRIDGPHMATVVGPAGEEIYCDPWGRVKVSFPWDRESQDDEFSSCWVRVSQGWAGGSWGSMAIPRIGQEVIIQYVNADPDQPMITGRTYCGNQLPPYDLPEHKTRMTIKSQTHKGDGFNELRFEDELGKQELYLHAERDQNTVVKHDQSTWVGRNRADEVSRDDHLTVGRDLQYRIGRDRADRVGRSGRLEIGQDCLVQVGKDQLQSIGANQQLTVGGRSEVLIKGEATATIGGGVTVQTSTYRLQASQRIELVTPGGSLVLDQQGITLNGLALTLQGPTSASAGGSSNALSLDLQAERSAGCQELKR